MVPQVLFVVMVLLQGGVTAIHGDNGLYKTVNMNDRCGSNVTLGAAGHILWNDPCRDCDCNVTFYTDSKKKIVLQFVSMDVPQFDNSSNCQKRACACDKQNRLEIWNGIYGDFFATRDRTVCRQSDQSDDFISQKSRISLHLGTVNSQRPGSFDIRFTTYLYTPNGPCPDDGLFKCTTNRRCIDPRLTCDGIQNCGKGDKSDESYYEAKCLGPGIHLTFGQIMGIAVGGFVLLALIALFCCVFVFKACGQTRPSRFNRRSRRRNHRSSGGDIAMTPLTSLQEVRYKDVKGSAHTVSSHRSGQQPGPAKMSPTMPPKPIVMGAVSKSIPLEIVDISDGPSKRPPGPSSSA